jgi:hypothetical protein
MHTIDSNSLKISVENADDFLADDSVNFHPVYSKTDKSNRNMTVLSSDQIGQANKVLKDEFLSFIKEIILDGELPVDNNLSIEKCWVNFKQKFIACKKITKHSRYNLSLDIREIASTAMRKFLDECPLVLYEKISEVSTNFAERIRNGLKLVFL